MILKRDTRNLVKKQNIEFNLKRNLLAIIKLIT